MDGCVCPRFLFNFQQFISLIKKQQKRFSVKPFVPQTSQQMSVFKIRGFFSKWLTVEMFVPCRQDYIFQSVRLKRNCFIFDKAYSNFSSTQTDLLNYLSCFLARPQLKDSYLLKWRYTRFKPYGSIRHYSPAFVDFQ